MIDIHIHRREKFHVMDYYTIIIGIISNNYNITNATLKAKKKKKRRDEI